MDDHLTNVICYYYAIQGTRLKQYEIVLYFLYISRQPKVSKWYYKYMSYNAPERPAGGPPKIESEEDFVTYYSGVPISFGEHSMPLSRYVQAEEMFCPSDSSARSDPFKRLGYLANTVLRSGGLDPMHYHLAPDMWEQQPR